MLQRKVNYVMAERVAGEGCYFILDDQEMFLSLVVFIVTDRFSACVLVI